LAGKYKFFGGKIQILWRENTNSLAGKYKLFGGKIQIIWRAEIIRILFPLRGSLFGEGQDL
jgi:hypothetical protein